MNCDCKRPSSAHGTCEHGHDCETLEEVLEDGKRRICYYLPRCCSICEEKRRTPLTVILHPQVT